jgi:hypothetical protein
VNQDTRTVEPPHERTHELIAGKTKLPNTPQLLTRNKPVNDDLFPVTPPHTVTNNPAGKNEIPKKLPGNVKNDGVSNDPLVSPSTVAITPADTKKDIPVTPIVKEEEKKITPANKPDPAGKKKNASSKKSYFFLSLSAGPDLSATEARNPGKVKLLAGAGLGYSYKDRFTLRTGFYTSRKVYSAMPDDYYPPDNSFWAYYPFMEKIDADCKVYEIPVSLSYQFGHTAKDHWFASAGLSSYLMKKETYKYYYKYTQSGPTVKNTWTLRNKNNHYFSVMTLSGGYQRNLGKTFSLTAEPYVKIPLGGVGYGKVKLKGAGMLVTVGIKPFAKNK